MRFIHRPPIRAALFAALAATAIAAAACGSEDDPDRRPKPSAAPTSQNPAPATSTDRRPHVPFANPAPDNQTPTERRVRHAYEKFLDAVEARRWKLACQSLATETLDESTTGGQPCPTALAKSFNALGENPTRPKVTHIEVHGDTADVYTASTIRGAGAAPVELVKERGRWKLTGTGGGP